MTQSQSRSKSPANWQPATPEREDGLAEPLVASRSERAILADVEAALNEAIGVPRRRGPRADQPGLF